MVYIDGLNFWNQSDFRNGETCVLESPTGIFSRTRIKAAPPKVMVD